MGDDHAALVVINPEEGHGVTSKSSVVGDGGMMLQAEQKRDKPRDLYCIVLPTDKFGPFKTKEQVDEYRQTIVNDMHSAGLEVTLFYSTQEDEVYVKVGANDARLLQEADHSNYVLELDGPSMKIIAESDKEKAIRKPIHLEAPFDRNQRIQALNKVFGGWHDIPDDEVTAWMRKETNLSPFQYLHAAYNDGWERYGKENYGVQIYRLYQNNTILRTADRMKLLQLILERSRQPDMLTGARGAGLNLQEIVMKKKALAVFPLQSVVNAAEQGEKSLDELYDEWNDILKLPWKQPIDDIRDYFGEKIALYFAFLGHYTMWLSVAGLVGLAIFIHQLADISNGTGAPNFFAATKVSNATITVYTEVPEVGIFAIFISLWATFMLEFWKRHQARLALKWGTSKFEQLEVVRPEFSPTHFLPSPVTGQSQPYYSFQTFALKIVSSMVVILFCIGIVISAIAGIFVFKVLVTVRPDQLDEQTGTYVALIVNAVVIMILGTVYKKIALILNQWENHRTDTQFEDALIAKTFVFCFVNSFATLFYLAFIKSGTVILGQTQLCSPEAKNTTGDACFGALGTSLLIIFLLQMILNNTMELVIPWVMELIKKYTNSKEKKSKDKKVGDEATPFEPKLRSPCEDQFFKKSYEGTFDDFLEIALQFGYVTLFVAAFPVAPFLAFLNNQLEIRVDSFKLCRLCRRPVNMGAQDIGTWQTIFYLMGLIAVMTNAGVVFFASGIIVIADGYRALSPQALRVWFWVISVVSILVFKWFVDFFLSDVPSEVKIQLAREEYLVRKCLLLERDDDEEDDPEKQIAESKLHDVEIKKADPMMLDIVANMAHKLISELGSLEAAFKKADRNNDGEVTTKEFKRLLKGMEGLEAKLTEDEINLIIGSLDYNSNGKVDYNEFIHLGKKA